VINPLSNSLSYVGVKLLSAGGKIVEISEFNYYNIFRRLIEIKKYFKPKAFLLFVVTKN